MRRRLAPTLSILLAVGLCVFAPGRARAGNTVTHPFPGVTHLHRTTPDQNIHVVTIDLCAAGVRVRTTAGNEAGRTTSSFGQLVGADIAVNGDFHEGDWDTHGPAAHAGNQWSGSDGAYTGPVAFGDKRAEVVSHQHTNGLKPWMKEVVSGHPTIVVNGDVAEPFVDPQNTDPLCNNRHPRTAAGLSEHGRKLILATVDGRQPGMKGMTCRELANLMKFFGAHRATNLDGGGSTTMWIRGKGVVSSPSDGRERTVSNHLAVVAPGQGEPRHCTRYKAAYAGGEGAFDEGTTVRLTAGETATGTMTFLNAGQLPWDGKTRMGTTEPRDRESPVATGSWIGPHRITAVASETAPGDVGRFTFTFRAPATPGTYREHFNLVQEGVTWFSESGGPPDDQFYFEVVSEKPEMPADAGSRPDAGADAGVDGGEQTDPDTGAARDATADTDLPSPPDPADTGRADTEPSPPDDRAPAATTTTGATCACSPAPTGTLDPTLLALLLILGSLRSSRRSTG